MLLRRIFTSQYRRWVIGALFVLLLFTIVTVQQSIRDTLTIKERIEKASYKEEKLRKMLFYGDSLYQLESYCKKRGKDFIHEVTMRAILMDYEIKDSKKMLTSPIDNKFRQAVKALPFYDKVYQVYQQAFQDVLYFPVPIDLSGKESVSFEDSFLDARTYGGNREHEGTDVIPSVKVSGYFPVLSVSDGVVENIGWLELGGWRVGISSESGGYYYYAHLDSYAPDLKVGDKVSAGELLGFMGDTGYGKKEGTKGKFIVHLHFGIYVDIEGNQVSVNPYPILN